MSSTLRNGESRDLNLTASDYITLVAVSGTYTATVVRGNSSGTVLGTNVTGGTYGPYTGGAVIRVVTSASSEVDFDIGASPVIVSDTFVTASTNPVTGMIEFSEDLRKSLFIVGAGDSHTNGQMYAAASSSGSTSVLNLPAFTPRDRTFDGANGVLDHLKLDSFLGDLTGTSDPNIAKSTNAISYLNFIPQNVRVASPLVGDISIANFGVGGSSAFTWAGEASRAYVHGVANATAGDTVTIAGVVYTFVTSASAANEVTIAGTANDTVQNLAHAINGEGAGFGAGTVANPLVYCPNPTSTAYQTLNGKASGVAGNALTVQCSNTSRIAVTNAALTVASSVQMSGGSAVSALYANMKTTLGVNVPDVFVFTLGTNDALRVGYRASGIQAELTNIVNNVHADFPAAKIVFVTPPRTTAGNTPDGLIDSAVVPAMTAVAAANPSFIYWVNAVALGTGTAGIFEVTNLSGGIHCSNYGYSLWATLVAKKICAAVGL